MDRFETRLAGGMMQLRNCKSRHIEPNENDVSGIPPPHLRVDTRVAIMRRMSMNFSDFAAPAQLG
jgi:hypothetical protein